MAEQDFKTITLFHTVAQKCNTQTQKRIHKRKTKYTNAKPNTQTQNQIHKRKTKYINAKENTQTQIEIHKRKGESHSYRGLKIQYLA